MRNAVCFVAVLLFAKASLADPGSSSDIFTPAQTGVSNVLLSSSPSFTILSRHYGAVTVYMNLTYAAATAITLKCTAGNFAAFQAPVGFQTVGADGTITMGDVKGWTQPTNATSRLFRVIVGPINDATLSCTVSGTGATTDRVSVAAYGGE